ncbi:hypothetical protein B0T22DRAFT_513343 [Podospora appendiculata]|uniref:Uncharacterized protein n=1 Tax=Podospora appendiculata TaxID=314037 RepID=A0AAE0XBH5_9PEZI|nr:hypothetical protein B0T22DRAFT_513343 [Podospora appendiculata]
MTIDARESSPSAQGGLQDDDRSFLRRNVKSRPPPRRSVLSAVGLWKLELVCLCLAVGVLIAIFATLVHYSGKDVPEWPSSVSLNSLVAIYTIILRALLMVPVAEVISQEKWLWFKRPRPLHHMDSFDSASRGLWGSTKLLFVSYTSAVPFIAAVTAIVMVAVGPFTQQSIKTNLCDRVVETTSPARLSFAAKIPTSEVVYNTYGKPQNINSKSMNALVGGLTSRATVTPVDFSCPTGNCTFPAFNGVTHSSVGICSRATAPRQRAANDATGLYVGYGWCNFTLTPPGSEPVTILPVIEGPTIAVNATGTNYTYAPYDAFNISILTRTQAGCDGRGLDTKSCPPHANLPGLQNEDFKLNIVGAKCTLFACLRDYHGEVINNNLTEAILSTTKLDGRLRFDSAMGVRTASPATAVLPCVVDGALYDASNMTLAMAKYNTTSITYPSTNTTSTVSRACVRWLDGGWTQMLSLAVKQILDGGCGSVGNARAQAAFHNTLCDEAWWLASLFDDDEASFASISAHVDDLAASLTNRLRAIGLSGAAAWNDTLPDVHWSDDPGVITGAAHATAVCVEFGWRWLLLPTALTAVTLCLLVVAVARTYADGAAGTWKSSALPLLFHGFRDEVQGMPPDHRMDLDEMKAAAAGMVARYEVDEHGGVGIVAGDKGFVGR